MLGDILKRREFIKKMGLAAGWGALSSPQIFAENLIDTVENTSELADDRILVLIYLKGGNDGLNTFIPLDIYDTLKTYRQDIIIPENSILEMTDDIGLHPSMPEIQSLWNDEKLCLIRDVGYEEPNMSHFRSREIVNTSSDSDEYLTTGWVGRHLQQQEPDFPVGFPSAEFPDPYVLGISSGGSQATQGVSGNFVTNVSSPGSKNNFNLDTYSDYSLDDGRYGTELEFLRQSNQQTHAIKDSLYNRFQNGPQQTETNDDLTNDLLNITRLIAGGSKTKIYMVEHKNFDTHGGQISAGDSTQGTHADLLRTLSKAIGTFQESLEKENIDDKVLSLVYTEFGRRIMSNKSLGTDHGHGSSWFCFGSKVNPVVHGTSPTLPATVSKKTNLPHQFDFKNVFYSVLTQWFLSPSSDSQSVFDITNEEVDIVKSAVSPILNKNSLHLQVGKAFPNPVINHSKIPFTLNEESGIEYQIFDSKGKLLQSHNLGNLNRGYHQILFRRKGEAPGKVIYKIKTNKGSYSGSLHLK